MSKNAVYVELQADSREICLKLFEKIAVFILQYLPVYGIL